MAAGPPGVGTPPVFNKQRPHHVEGADPRDRIRALRACQGRQLEARRTSRVGRINGVGDSPAISASSIRAISRPSDWIG
ncbi:hypothetical protein GCM10029976_026030 [Kribbella albertanoniae]